MAKQISQETFDDTVKENIEEFDLTPQEAVEDAVKQFESQGVNLSNIVKELSLQGCGEDGSTNKHPVVAAVESLEGALKKEPLDLKQIQTDCGTITKECDIDLAHRQLAEKTRAFPILINAIRKFRQDQESLAYCLAALVSLCDGQPDLISDKEIDLFLDLLRIDMNLSGLTVRLIRLTCTKHEANRQSYVAQGLVPLLLATIEKHRDDVTVVKEVCSALRILTVDDDIRAQFGKAHDHAKMIVNDAEGLKKIIGICKDYTDNTSVLSELFATLSRLAVRNEFCQEIVDLGGLTLLLGALEQHSQQQALTKQILLALKSVAGNDKVKDEIAAKGGIEQIVDTMCKYVKRPGVCTNGCAALTMLVLRNPPNCQKVMDNNGPDVILKAMQLHPDDDTLQIQACRCIRNLVARTKQHCAVFLEHGAEALIRTAQTNHAECRDDAKAALRDLGCNIELKERWTGQVEGVTN